MSARGRGLLAGAFAGLVALSAASCGGKGAETAAATHAAGLSVDGDAVALLPSGGFLAGHVDAKAIFAAGLSGARAVALADAYNPYGDRLGVVPSRDVDEITFEAFAGASAEVVGIARGRFDPARFAAAAEEARAAGEGGLVVASQYRGAPLLTIANVGFSILSPKTLLVGTEGGIRRVIDRVRDGASEAAPPLGGELAAAARGTAAATVAFEAPPGGAAAALLKTVAAQVPGDGGAALGALVGGRAELGIAGDRLHARGLLAAEDGDSAETMAKNLNKLSRMYALASLVTALPTLREARIERGQATAEDATGDRLVRVDLEVDDRPLARALGAVPIPR